MNLQKFLAAIRRYWKTFVAISALVSAVLLAWILLTPATFVSSTQLLVSISGSTTAGAYQNDDVVAGRIHSYIALLTTNVVDQRVIDKLKLPMTAAELAAKVSATNVPSRTSLIDVAVEDTSRERAQLLASTLANEFVSYTDALETPTGEDDQKVHTTVVSTATKPLERRAERVALVVLGAATALLLGAVAVWIRWRFDPVTRTAEDAVAAAEVPVIARVTPAWTLGPSELAEYRRLGNQLEAITTPSEKTDGRGHLWILASAAAEMEVASIASHLGRALKIAGGRVVIVGSGIARLVPTNESTPDNAEDVRAEPADSCVDGPTEPDSEARTPDDAQPPVNGDDEMDDTDSSEENTVDTSTEPSIHTGQAEFPDMLSVKSWPEGFDPVATTTTVGRLDRLRDDYTHVIVAAPPTVTSSAASIIGERADAVVLVVSLDVTRREDVERTASKLRAAGVLLAGVVISVGRPPHRAEREGDTRSGLFTEFNLTNGMSLER